MNGAQHFAESEECLDKAAEAEYGSDEERYYLAVADVHATLALVAATLESKPQP